MQRVIFCDDVKSNVQNSWNPGILVRVIGSNSEMLSILIVLHIANFDECRRLRPNTCRSTGRSELVIRWNYGVEQWDFIGTGGKIKRLCIKSPDGRV